MHECSPIILTWILSTSDSVLVKQLSFKNRAQSGNGLYGGGGGGFCVQNKQTIIQPQYVKNGTTLIRHNDHCLLQATSYYQAIYQVHVHVRPSLYI